MKLPTGKTKPTLDMSKLSMLIYGQPKIGKSTFCSRAEGALFLATEPGLNALETYNVTIDSWADMLEATDLIAKGKHNFKTIIIDTIDNLFGMCVDFICQRENIKNIGDLGYGKGYSMLDDEFKRIIFKLARLPYGLIFVSHAQQMEVPSRTGIIQRVVPTLPKRARKVIIGLVDIIGYANIITAENQNGQAAERRILQFTPTETVEAGDRTGRLNTMPLNYHIFLKRLTGESTQISSDSNVKITKQVANA